jgi:hypothetical protein
MGKTSTKNWIASIAAFFIAAGGGPGLFAAQQPANWLGGNSNWADATKWSTGVVPNNNATDTYTVNIDNGNPVASTVWLGRRSSGSLGVSIDSLTAARNDSRRDDRNRRQSWVASLLPQHSNPR